ncbi:MAG: 3-hydroxylacyl-ACP dehydratase [Burkholderiaceae bacterium]
MLKHAIDTLLPHSGRMRLIDRVVSYDEQGIICETDSHRAADHPLAENGVLSIVCGLEYGAQAMAIHGALLAAAADAVRRPRRGYLVAASGVCWFVERLDTCAAPLSIEAVAEFTSENQVAYRFRIDTAGATLLTGHARVQLGA